MSEERCPKCGAESIIKEFWPLEWEPRGVKQAWGCGSFTDKEDNLFRGGIGESSCYARELATANARIAELEREKRIAERALVLNMSPECNIDTPEGSGMCLQDSCIECRVASAYALAEAEIEVEESEDTRNDVD